MGQANPTGTCCGKNCCGEADGEITTTMRRGARPMAPGLPQNLPLGPDAPGSCIGPAAAQMQSSRCRDSKLEPIDESGGCVMVAERRFDAPEETAGRPDPAMVGFEMEDQEVEGLAVPPPDFQGGDPKDVMPLPRPASPKKEDKIGEYVPSARPAAEVTPEPEPSPPSHVHAPAEGSQQQARRWQSPANSRPSRAEEEELRQTVVRHAQGGLVYTFRLPDGSHQTLDFTSYAQNGEALGLDVNKQAPITVSRIAPGSAAHCLGVQPGWLITHLGDQSFEEQEPSVFFRISKHVIHALKAEAAPRPY